MKIFIIFIGAILIVFLADSVCVYNEGFLARHGLSRLNNDIFYKTFGEFKNFLSDVSYVEADVYYHGGIYDFHEHEGEPCGCIMGKVKQKDVNAVHEHKGLQRVKPSLNILLDVGEAMHITEHRHLEGDEEKEVIPWIYYAVRLNPHNEAAYAVGGFWLAVQLKKPNKAIELLKEGIANNPDSWELYATLGQVYLVNKKDYKNAKTYLEKAKELGGKRGADKFDKMRIYSFLAEAYVKLGEKDNALKLYKSILILFPGNEAMEGKIKEISLSPLQKEAGR